MSLLRNILLGFLFMTAVGCLEVTTHVTIPPSEPQAYCGCETDVGGQKKTWTPSQVTELGCATFCDNLDNWHCEAHRRLQCFLAVSPRRDPWN